MTGVIELLAHYPPPVIEKILSPVFGLPSKHKFLPLIAEIREACEIEMGPYRREEDRQRLVDEAARRLPPPTIPRDQRPFLEDLKAKHGPNWGLKTVDRAADDAARLRREALFDRANARWINQEVAE